jgi:pimeloyl-ACP methyl ester carboxylesterase
MKTHCTLAGDGPHQVIALHGWFGSADGWGPLPQMLDSSRFSYAFMDYRGYGAAMASTGDYTIGEIARDTIALADSLGWDKFSLVGHSMGGMAIQQVLLDAPERVRKLVAITPVPACGVPFDSETWALFASAAGNLEARQAIIDMSTGQRLSPHWIGAMARRSQRLSREDAVAAYLTAWARHDFSALVAGNPAHIKVIIGEHDPALDAAVMTATFLRWFPNAVLETIGNAGHYPMIEAPVALITSIENFLAAPAA